MADEIIFLDNISDYDALVGAETLHPLVNVVDFNRLPPMRNLGFRRRLGYYAIYLKGGMSSVLQYGRSTYSYEEGAMVFFAPGQVIGTEDDGKLHQIRTRVLMFHPDLLRGTDMEKLMPGYSYFSYNVNEALYPTDSEKALIIDLFGKIEDELRRTEEDSVTIVIDYIRLVLDLCSRFYRRQFEAEEVRNQDILASLEGLLETYFNSEAPYENGVPSVAFIADSLHLSPNYFNDLVHKFTGSSALKLIHRKMLDIAVSKLSDPTLRINEIAASLGFQQPQNFTAWFKKQSGLTPQQFRNK